MSPSLTWEVIERVIDHLQYEVTALCCCALTCRQLRPRTRFHLLARVRVGRKDQLESLIGLLDAEPRLRSLVRSVSISLKDIIPLPLLVLPNVSHWKFVSDNPWYYRPMIFHSATLLCCRHLGTHVQNLTFDSVWFVNSMAFIRILLAFPNVRLISCCFAKIHAKGADAPRELVKERLVRQTRVTKLSIGRDVDAMTFELLLGVVHNAVQHLDVTITQLLAVASSAAIISAPQELQFPHLHTLIVHLWCKRHNTIDAMLRCIIELFRNFTTTLQEVRLEFSCYRGLHHLSSWLTKENNVSLCRELEALVLRVALPAISFSSPQAIRASRRTFWAGEFGWYFPTLHRRGQIEIMSETTDGPHSHDAAVSVLAVSPDSKWVASGSADSTIILWDVHSAQHLPAHEWVAHVGGVDRLAFSPSDGQLLASSGKDNAVTLWAVRAQDSEYRDVKCVTCLREVERMWRVELCGWAGDSLLFTSRTKSKAVVRMWDTRTSTQRQLLAGRSIQVVPSPSWDGVFRVLSTKDDAAAIRVREIDKDMDNDMGVRDIASLACDKCVTSPPKDASCSSGGRLAITYGDAQVLVWDLEADRSDTPASAGPPRPTELTYPAGNVKGIAVSPDGSRVLAWGGNRMTIWSMYARNGFAESSLTGISFEGHSDRILAASFSPDGKYVVSASKDGTMRLWNTSTGTCITALAEYSECVECVVFSPDGNALSSADTNGTVVIRPLRDVIILEGHE